MHAKVKEGHNEQETTRGASLRELQRFFEKKDSRKGYAGLCRVGDKDGTAVWTILKNEEVATKLEERAKEWQEEERRRDNLFNAQVRALSETVPSSLVPAQTAEASATGNGAVDELKRLNAELELANSELKVKNEQLLVDA